MVFDTIYTALGTWFRRRLCSTTSTPIATIAPPPPKNFSVVHYIEDLPIPILALAFLLLFHLIILTLFIAKSYFLRPAIHSTNKAVDTSIHNGTSIEGPTERPPYTQGITPSTRDIIAAIIAEILPPIHATADTATDAHNEVISRAIAATDAAILTSTILRMCLSADSSADPSPTSSPRMPLTQNIAEVPTLPPISDN